MSTESKKTSWLVILPDYEGALEKRLAVRQQHFSNLQPLISSGFLTMGGSFLEEPAKEGEMPKMKGSALMAEASSREELVKVLEEDAYTKGGVWDLAKVQIYPFLCAYQKGKDLPK